MPFYFCFALVHDTFKPVVKKKDHVQIWTNNLKITDGLLNPPLHTCTQGIYSVLVWQRINIFIIVFLGSKVEGGC